MENFRRDDPISEFFGDFADRLRGDRWQPAVDVFETEKAIVVRAEIAGVRSADLRVTVEGQQLCIRGVRTPPDAGGGHSVERLHQMEIAFGPFERLIRIGVPFDSDRVTAVAEDGFLRVTLPKRIPVQRQVEIER